MMNTPICEFVRRYAESRSVRLHMPGHKGIPLLGPESLDITEIDGADSLYEAEGIIRESEANASTLFGAHTFYSTEGSSLCICAMLYLALLCRGERSPRIAAGRNAHKAFLHAVALLDLEVDWLLPKEGSSYLSCALHGADIEAYLSSVEEKPIAIYITSPDYLGNTIDVEEISTVCHKYGVLLLVDNAHGAYLKFLPTSRHPMDLGADLCCDSAHKTLPALTGAAYLHISHAAPAALWENAKQALALFGSTSPSYLILQSLDAVNHYLANGYAEKLASFLPRVSSLKARLTQGGYALSGDEPLKLTVCPKFYGYTGQELASILAEGGLICEFSDPDATVMMLTPELSEGILTKVEKVLLSLPKRKPILESPPLLVEPLRACSARQAALAPRRMLSAKESVGHILAMPTVGCPPAVPIVVCGERITEEALRCFTYYGISACAVVDCEKEKVCTDV